MERDYLYDSDLVGAFTFDFDDLKMYGHSYFKTGSSKSQYYNYAYAEALEIIGLLYCNDDRGKNSEYHKGVAFVAKTVGVSKSEIKALRKNFKTRLDYVFKIPYKADRIVETITELLKSRMNDPIVKEFIRKQDSMLFMIVLIGKQYYSIKAVSKLDSKIYKLYKSLNKLD